MTHRKPFTSTLEKAISTHALATCNRSPVGIAGSSPSRCPPTLFNPPSNPPFNPPSHIHNGISPQQKTHPQPPAEQKLPKLNHHSIFLSISTSTHRLLPTSTITRRSTLARAVLQMARPAPSAAAAGARGRACRGAAAAHLWRRGGRRGRVVRADVARRYGVV